MKTFKLTVSKITPVLTLTQIVFEGYDTVMANLSQRTATGTVTFTLQGTDYPVEYGGDVCYFQIDGRGYVTVDVKYSGDKNFNPASNSINMVLGNPTKLSAKSITKVYGDSKKLIINLVDSKSKVVSGNSVDIRIYSSTNALVKSYNYKTDSNGQIKLSCNFKPGSYFAYVQNEDDAIKVKFVVNKATPVLTASKKTFKVKTKTKKYTITLKVNGKVMKSKKVTLKVNGKTYTAKTDSKGKATFKITKLTKKGTFTAQIKYAGDSYYKAVTKKVKITVKK